MALEYNNWYYIYSNFCVLSPNKINWFLLFKLPSAWMSGVRVKGFDSSSCRVGVRHRWINQNPFRSMYFAVQQMAAELSTGVLVMKHIGESKKPVSMLVVETKSQFYKKATGSIVFECKDGDLAQKAILQSLAEGSSQKIKMSVKAYNEAQDIVSEFTFIWSIKPKAK